MKAALLLATCSLAVGADMTARFANGDSLHGMLQDVGADSIQWSSEALSGPQSLRRDRFVDVLIRGAVPMEPPEGDHIATATLTNGDELSGTLLSVNARRIRLRTSYAGELTLRRDMVAKLDIENRPEIYFDGPNSIDEWDQQRDDGWEYEDGVLRCRNPSGIGRDFGRHDRFRLSFDVQWAPNSQLRVVTCADATDHREVRNGFELTCQGRSARLRKRTRVGDRPAIDNLGSTPVAEFQNDDKLRVEFLQDLRTGRSRLIVSGRVVVDWQDPNPGGRFGEGIIFVDEGGSDLALSRIRLTSWDGTVEGEWHENAFNFMQLGEFEEEPEPEPEDTTGIVLRNGDRMEGETLGIENGRIRVKTPLKEIELPVSRLRSFPLRTAEEAEDPELCWKPKLYAGDIRAWFADGGVVTFDLTGFSDGRVRGHSQTFGDAEFDLDAFSRLEFNIYNRRPDRIPDASWFTR